MDLESGTLVSLRNKQTAWTCHVKKRQTTHKEVPTSCPPAGPTPEARSSSDRLSMEATAPVNEMRYGQQGKRWLSPWERHPTKVCFTTSRNTYDRLHLRFIDARAEPSAIATAPRVNLAIG